MNYEIDDKLSQLESELNEARNMAMLCMGNSADLGLVIQFLKKSFNTFSYSELGHDLIDHLASLNLNASVLVISDEGPLYINLSGEEDLIDESYIFRYRESGRIYESNGLVLINYEHVSLLIHNFPEDEHRAGQLRDSLATLMEGIEARIKSLLLISEAEIARKGKDEFIALMSHELRTPLNPIMGFASYLAKQLGDKLEERQARALTSITDNAKNMLAMINEILDFAKIKDGEIKLHKNSVDVNEYLRSVCREVKPVAEANNTELVIYADEEIEFYLDPARFSNVVKSLVSNAIKYSPNGRVEIKTEILAQTDNSLQLTVKDNGKGIRDEDMERIFHHFTKSGAEAINHHSGAGIGLYTTREIVRLHGGKIVVESQLGVGSQFSAIFPQVLA